MPLGPRIRPHNSPANKQFTDRLAFIEAFDQALERLRVLDEATYQVLVYYGVGGIGKSALRQHLGRTLDTRAQAKWAVVDFEAPANRETEHALFVMRNELKRKYTFRFPLFDLAYALYWERTHPQTALARSDIPGLEEGDLLLDLMLAVEDVPGLGLLTKLPKAIAKLGGQALAWWRGREDEMRAFAGLEPQEMLERLSLFWALDLKRALAVTGEKVVLFLDTYEALWQGKGVEHLRFSVDQWVRDWVLHLPQVLWVVGGREKLAWAELDADWNEALDQHLIGALAEEDARRFLRTAGVAETGIQDVILQSAQGVPFYLDLAVDTHVQLVTTGHHPTATDFARTPRKVLDRFLKYLDRSERETLNVLSAARTWNRLLFERLITEFQTGYPPTALRELCRFSFVEEQAEAAGEEPTWTMHALMREGLHAYGDPTLITRVHRFLYAHYDTPLQDLDPKALTEPHRQALHEAFFHGQQVLAPEAFLAWYSRTEEAFRQAAQWRLLIPLQEQLTVFAEQQYGAESEATAEALNNLAGLYYRQGRYGEAEPLYLRSLALYEKVFGTEHPHVATSLNNLAGLYDNLGRYEEAEPLFLRSLAISEKVLGAEHPEVAQSQNNLAVLYHKLGRYGEAEPLYLRSLPIREKALGTEHPYVATSLNNLAGLYEDLGRYGEAEPLFLRSLAISEKVLGAEHPDVAASQNNLAGLYYRLGRYDEAEPLFLRSLSIRENVLGADHPHVAQSLNNLAFLYDYLGRYEEAEPLYLRSLSIRENVLGAEHPLTKSVRKNYRACLNAQHRSLEDDPIER